MLRKSKKLLSVVISLAILATMLSGFSVFAAGNTLTVGAGQTYSTIAAALAVATDGDTIYLVNGTYALPHTEIANNITIEGQSKAGVVLTPTAGTGSNKDVIAAGWLAVNTGGTLTVNNLTMDGSGQTVLVALWTIGALTVNNITIKNVKWADNLGTGIAVYRTGNLVATNVTMSNIGRLGIHAKAAATITGFSYTGKGVNNCLDYAMEIGTVATTVIPFTVNVTNATITDCLGVAYDGSGSAGIYVNTYFYSAQGGLTNLITANLSNINFYNCSTAFYSGYDETLGEYSNTTINNSNFINCEYDLAYYGKAGTGTVTTNGNFYGGAPVVDFSAGTTLTVGTPNIINKAFLNGTLYDTIAAAYAASVAGDTVYVGGTMDLNTNAGAGPAPLGGTVISALIVDKNITIMGTGIDPTITCSLINPNGTTVGVVSIYMKQGEIKNLTVKRPAGDGPNLVVSGVYLQGTAKITNCTVKNFRTGIEARGNNEIVGNTIESNRTGILYLSSDSITPIVKIINNTVIDNRTFGILFLDGGTYGGHPGRVYSTGYSFTIKGNEIYDNWFAELESRNVNAIDITNNFWGAQGPVLIHDYVNETLHPADGGSIISTKPGRPAGGIYQPTHSTSVTKSTNDAYKDFTAGVLTLDIVAPAVAQTLSVT
ncbi:MAG: right-handed parallel beta-helix repeat-containing protein, partial [Eubacteriales bacterium]